MNRRFGMCDQDEKALLKQNEELQKVMMHLQFEGKVSRAKNLAAAKIRLSEICRLLSKHCRLEEEVVFPFLEVYIPKLESLIHFLRADHRELLKRQSQLNRKLCKLLAMSHPGSDCELLGHEGIYFVCLLRQHLEFGAGSLVEVAEKILSAEEKREISRRIKIWEKQQQMSRLNQKKMGRELVAS